MAAVEEGGDEELFSLIEQDPIEAAKLCQARIKADHDGIHVQRRRRLVEAYRIAERLKGDYELWRQFVADPIFDEDSVIRKPGDERFQYIVTRAVLIYLFSVIKSNKSMRNRIWRYARALDYYADQKMPAAELVERIKNDGGIEKVCARVSHPQTSEDEEKDWKSEMRSRMSSAAVRQIELHEAEVEKNKLAELPPDDYGEPAAWLILDDAQEKFVRGSGRNNKLFLIVEKVAVDDCGKPILSVDCVDNLDTWDADGRQAMREWQRDVDDEFSDPRDEEDGEDEDEEDTAPITGDDPSDQDLVDGPINTAFQNQRGELSSKSEKSIFYKRIRMRSGPSRKPLVLMRHLREFRRR